MHPNYLLPLEMFAEAHLRFGRGMRSTFGSHVWVFPEAGKLAGSILGSYLSIEGGFGLPFGLQYRCSCFLVACWSPPFVGLHDSLGASVPRFRAALDVLRRARKRLRVHLAAVGRATQPKPTPVSPRLACKWRHLTHSVQNHRYTLLS
jgi:hypothetical protein